MAGWGVEVSFSSSIIQLFAKTWSEMKEEGVVFNQLNFVYSKYIPKLKAPKKSKHPLLRCLVGFCVAFSVWICK